MASPPLGNLVRLFPLSLTELPFHPSIAEHFSATNQSSPSKTSFLVPSEPSSYRTDPSSIPQDFRPLLATFLSAVLSEASSFIGATIPSTFKPSSTTSSKPSAADVQILKRSFPPKEIESAVSRQDTPLARSGKDAKRQVPQDGENWCVRKSVHVNKAAEGTAEWAEFDAGLRKEHNENEANYTPDVYDAYRVLDWDEETAQIGKDDVPGFEQVQMRIYEMCHKLPPPLAPRTFPVLVVQALEEEAASGEARAGIVVHIPVNLSSFPSAMYSNGRNIKEGADSQKQKKVVLGTYASIERIKLVESDKVEWMMACASDASGVLPMWAQKMGLPGAIAKDVGLFLKWVAGKRPNALQQPAQPAP